MIYYNFSSYHTTLYVTSPNNFIISVSSIGKMDSSVKSRSDFTFPDYTQKAVGNEWLREKDSITLPKVLFNKGNKINVSTFSASYY